MPLSYRPLSAHHMPSLVGPPRLSRTARRDFFCLGPRLDPPNAHSVYTPIHNPIHTPCTPDSHPVAALIPAGEVTRTFTTPHSHPNHTPIHNPRQTPFTPTLHPHAHPAATVILPEEVTSARIESSKKEKSVEKYNFSHLSAAAIDAELAAFDTNCQCSVCSKQQ